MTRIERGANVATVINVFTVEPENQERLLRLLIDATEQVMCKLPGFISANFHRSLDGTRIVNYAQWSSREAFERMFFDPRAVEHMMAMRGLATSDRNLYEVVSVHDLV